VGPVIFGKPTSLSQKAQARSYTDCNGPSPLFFLGRCPVRAGEGGNEKKENTRKRSNFLKLIIAPVSRSSLAPRLEAEEGMALT